MTENPGGQSPDVKCEGVNLNAGEHPLRTRSVPEDKLASLKLVLGFTKVLIWPLLIVTLFVSYRGPIRTGVDGLAQRIASADKVSIGSLSLEMRKQAQAIGDEDLARRVGELSPQATQLLLRASPVGKNILVSVGRRGDKDPTFGLPTAKNLAALRELKAREFIEFEEDLEGFLVFFETLAMEKIEVFPDRDTYIPLATLSSSDNRRIRQ